MYSRVFDVNGASKTGRAPELTEEGHALLARANIKPAEIIQKSYEDFLY